jgi:hypothetical protein
MRMSTPALRNRRLPSKHQPRLDFLPTPQARALMRL